MAHGVPSPKCGGFAVEQLFGRKLALVVASGTFDHNGIDQCTPIGQRSRSDHDSRHVTPNAPRAE